MSFQPVSAIYQYTSTTNGDLLLAVLLTTYSVVHVDGLIYFQGTIKVITWKYGLQIFVSITAKEREL